MYIDKLREEISKAIDASDDPQTVITLSDLFDDVVRLEAIVYAAASTKARDLKRTPNYKEARTLVRRIKRTLRTLKREKLMRGVAASLSNWYLYAVAGGAAAVLFPGIEGLLENASNFDPGSSLVYVLPLLKEVLKGGLSI